MRVHRIALASQARAHAPMRPRDPREPFRVASTLELFFDLVFVIAVSVASVQLHHALAEGHVASGLLHYGMAFFGIWWAWMNFTWFATSFDTDDWLYRVLTVLQMAGVLVLAAGLEPAFDDDFRLLVAGYVVMRVAMIAQWLRAAASAGERARTARLYALGIGVAQVLWVAWLFAPAATQAPLFVVLALLEISVPVLAERIGGTTPWHPHHITERYGAFTLILLGESLLGSANAILGALHSEAGVELSRLLGVAALSLVVTAAMWWIYFWPPHHERIGGLRQSLAYGYVHYLVFAAAGAFSAGIEVEIDELLGHGELGQTGASLAVSVPVAVFVLGVWWLAIRPSADLVVNVAVPAGAVLVLLDPVLPILVGVTALVLVAVVVVLVLRPPIAREAHSAA